MRAPQGLEQLGVLMLVEDVERRSQAAAEDDRILRHIRDATTQIRQTDSADVDTARNISPTVAGECRRTRRA